MPLELDHLQRQQPSTERGPERTFTSRLQHPRILLIDDETSYVEMLAEHLQRELDARIVGKIATWDPLLKPGRGLHADLVLADVCVDRQPITQALQLQRHGSRNVQVAVLSDFFSDTILLQAVELGVQGYLLKSSAFREVIEGVRTILSGRKFFSASIARRLIESSEAGEFRLHDPSHISQLTPRQREVLTLVGQGYTSKQIAEVLLISPKSVESQKYRLMRILGVNDRLQLALAAVREGIVSLWSTAEVLGFAPKDTVRTLHRDS